MVEGEFALPCSFAVSSVFPFDTYFCCPHVFGISCTNPVLLEPTGTVDGTLRIYRIKKGENDVCASRDIESNREHYHMHQKHCYSSEEIYFENIGRLLDRRDSLRQGYLSIYDNDTHSTILHGGSPNSNVASTSHHTVTQRQREEAVVPVVSSLPKWARGVPSNRSESAGRCTNSVMKPSRTIVLLQYRNASSHGVENEASSEDEGDSIFCPEPFINLDGQMSHLIVGTAKAVLHVSTNTYTVDSVLEFDHSDVLNHVVSKTESEGVVKRPTAVSPLAARAMQIATSRHPPRALPGIQLSTACMFERADEVNESEVATSVFLFIANAFKGDCHVIQIPSNEHVNAIKCRGKNKRIYKRASHTQIQSASDHTKLNNTSGTRSNAFRSLSSEDRSCEADQNVKNRSCHQNENNANQSNTFISTFPSATQPLNDCSPLRLAYDQSIRTSSSSAPSVGASRHRKIRKNALSSRRKMTGSRCNPKVVDKPVTFHTRIRSSGYGKPPKHSTLFGKQDVSKRKKKAFGSTAFIGGTSHYPAKEELRYSKGTIKTYKQSSGPLVEMKFTSDAKTLSMAFADGTATSCRLPFGKDRSPARYVGHEGPITSIDWNCNQQLKLLLTSSEDGAVKIWKRNRPAAVLELRPKSSNTSSVKTSKFFYMDKFLMLATSNRLEMYKYAVDHLTDEKNDLRRLQNHSKCKLVRAWNENSQTINSIALQNNFFSHVVITAGTNRSIHVYDINEGKLIKEIEQAHGRSVHSVILPTLSDYTSLPTNIYDVFASSATDGKAKLWDLRASCQCVRTFQEHANRVHKTGIAFSPCMRYIACGSEDKCTYVYDIRNGQVLDKLRGGHNDSVTCCMFNPRYPQMVSGSIDGKCTFYNL